MSAQIVTQRGFIEGSALPFPQKAVNDPTQVVADLLVRAEVFVKPSPWIQFAAGVDARANSHEQVDTRWRIDVSDRGPKRPALGVRRLSATITKGSVTVDAGKQFIRWGKTDVVTPTDRFAPRDFLNVITAEFLPVTGVRATLQSGSNILEGVWVPRLTPSRIPLLDQRWTAVPPEAAAVPIVDDGATIPDGQQAGVRWSHIGTVEFAASFFNGFNHLPNIDSRVVLFPPRVDITRTYPRIRAYGLDAAVPTPWFTLKGETEYFTSPSATGDEFVLYVLQLERQSGEWVFVGGYAGEHVTRRRSALAFAPDRGVARAIVGRASYTVDPRRTVGFEAAARQNGNGVYAKGEYSETSGQHWRVTLAFVGIAGHRDDFLGQYRRNSHAAVSLRYSF